MGKAMFYHLTRRPLEAALPQILEASLSRGWNVALRGTERARLARLDEKLWQGGEESFLPHGLSGGAHDARQPVLLTEGREMPNGAACIVSVDGAEVSAEGGRRAGAGLYPLQRLRGGRPWPMRAGSGRR